MKRTTEKELVRLLIGELPEPAAGRLRRRLREDVALRNDYARLERQWRSLELPAPAAAPAGFARDVLGRVRARQAGRGAPVWWRATLLERAAAAAVLAGGIVLGALLAAPAGEENWDEIVTIEPSMAESYWTVIDESLATLQPGSRP
jgi:anti-sigma factor RsiW